MRNDDDDLERAVNEAGDELEGAFRGIDRLNVGDVPIADADPADRDLPIRGYVEWPNGEVTEVRAGFPKRDTST